MSSSKTFYITTPIYYPSGNLHIGHVYTTVIAYTLRNYKALMGYDARLLTGADEHGQKIAQKAESLHISPQAYVDREVAKFKDLWSELGIDYDYFSRTTDPKHHASVQKQFSKLLQINDIYKDKYEGLYSVQDEEFLTPTQARQEGEDWYHPTSGHKLSKIAEPSYFFKLSKYEDWLKNYLNEHPNFIFPSHVKQELVNNFLDKGLDDLSISRTTFQWGIPIIEDPSHVMYVWFDALNNYLTALGFNQDNDDDYQKYWNHGDEIVHVVGKEIARFHAIYWPIFLRASNLKLPSQILAHGWIVTPTGKMSKSKNNVVDPLPLIKKYGKEAVKYFFASQVTLGQDGVFDEENLKFIYNGHLVNNYGNLLSRTFAIIAQNFPDQPLVFEHSTHEVDQNILDLIGKRVDEFHEELATFNLCRGFERIVDLSSALNKYIEVVKPWTLKDNPMRLKIVLNYLLQGIYATSLCLSIVIPEKTKIVFEENLKLKKSFNLVKDWTKFDKIIVSKGEAILFERFKL